MTRRSHHPVCPVQVALAVFVVLATACSRGSDKPKSEKRSDAAALRSAKLTCSKNLWCTLPIVAIEKGFFREEGLAVELSYVQAAKFSMDALVGGSTDFAGVVEINVAYLGFTGNENIAVIGTIVESHDGAIVARKSAGVTTPADLAGKSLGVLQGTTSQVFADRFLARNGIAPDGVTVTNLQLVAIQTALVEKGVAAGSVWQPFTYNLVKALGDDAIVFKDPEAYTGFMNVAVRRDWLRANEDRAGAFVRGLARSARFVSEHPDEAQRIVAPQIGLDPAVVGAIWSDYRFGLTLDPQRLIGAIAAEGTWIKSTQRGFADKTVPEYGSYVDPRFIESFRAP